MLPSVVTHEDEMMTRIEPSSMSHPSDSLHHAETCAVKYESFRQGTKIRPGFNTSSGGSGGEVEGRQKERVGLPSDRAYVCDRCVAVVVSTCLH